MRNYASFAIAGSAGFLTDAAVLVLFIEIVGTGPFIGRVFSIAAALLVTWIINRTFTFTRSRRHILTEGARYGGVAAGTALFNYGLYSGLLLAVPALPPLAALAVSSLTAMAVSYLGYSRLVFDR